MTHVGAAALKNIKNAIWNKTAVWSKWNWRAAWFLTGRSSKRKNRLPGLAGLAS
jgi:hypothetical protein